MSTGTGQPWEFSLEQDAWGQLVLVLGDGRRFEGIEVARAFPISAPGEYISISDATGHEILCIEDPGKLPPHLIKILEEELSRREFVPVVKRIARIAADSDPSQWEIETDRGATTFLMEDSDNDLRRLGPYRILLTDTHGIRYLINDARRLDAASRRLLDRYM